MENYPRVHPLLLQYDNHPMLKYYQSEYKADWEYQFVRHLEERSLRAKLGNVISKIRKSLFPTEQELFEEKLANAKDLYEIESLQRSSRVGLVA